MVCRVAGPVRERGCHVIDVEDEVLDRQKGLSLEGGAYHPSRLSLSTPIITLTSNLQSAVLAQEHLCLRSCVGLS